MAKPRPGYVRPKRKAIRRARKKAGLSLAKAAAGRRQWLFLVERGLIRTTPRAVIEAIAKRLNVDPNSLISKKDRTPGRRKGLWWLFGLRASEVEEDQR